MKSEALQRVQRYVEMRNAKPILGLGDTIHAIHIGTEWAAEITLSDLEQVLREVDNVERRAGEWLARTTLAKGHPGCLEDQAASNLERACWRIVGASTDPVPHLLRMLAAVTEGTR